jgi:hypothetical protein
MYLLNTYVKLSGNSSKIRKPLVIFKAVGLGFFAGLKSFYTVNYKRLKE